MKTRENHFMVDIETTGVDQKTDDILQVGAIELEQVSNGFWHPTGKIFDWTLHNKRQPESDFAKKHMKELYLKCNEVGEQFNLEFIADKFREFIHGGYYGTHMEPKFFMGWNASNFDMPFLFNKGILTPSFYDKNPDTGKEQLYGDAHYRIYEQTGSVQFVADLTGLDRKTIEALAMDLNPTHIKLPKGKEHDALYDCYKQTIMQNGLIQIARSHINKWGL